MNEKDQPTPRVGDTITTAEQFDALPVGSMVVSRWSGIEFHKMRNGGWISANGSAMQSTWMVAEEDEYDLYRPDAPRPAPVDGDAVERALAAWVDSGPMSGPGVYESWPDVVKERMRPRMAAALAAAGMLKAFGARE